jgi:hypothetical protein
MGRANEGNLDPVARERRAIEDLLKFGVKKAPVRFSLGRF